MITSNSVEDAGILELDMLQLYGENNHFGKLLAVSTKVNTCLSDYLAITI